MEKEQAISILHFYRDIDKDINLFRHQINDIEEQYYCSVGAVQFSGNPKGNAISSPTENYALNIPEHIHDERIRLERKIKKMQDLKIAIESEIDKLPYKQKKVVIAKDIRRMKWVQISAQCYYCERQCKYIRAKALKKLCVYFSENPTIANYVFPN